MQTGHGGGAMEKLTMERLKIQSPMANYRCVIVAL